MTHWPLRRVAVNGDSMRPALEPGDRLLVVRLPRQRPRLRLRLEPGDVVAVVDPRDPNRVLVKRVTDVDANGRVTVAGDNQAASTDSRTFGAVDADLVVGRAFYRYWPQARRGRLRK